jgi:hypothetical protein
MKRVLIILKEKCVLSAHFGQGEIDGLESIFNSISERQLTHAQADGLSPEGTRRDFLAFGVLQCLFRAKTARSLATCWVAQKSADIIMHKYYSFR